MCAEAPIPTCPWVSYAGNITSIPSGITSIPSGTPSQLGLKLKNSACRAGLFFTECYSGGDFIFPHDLNFINMVDQK